MRDINIRKFRANLSKELESLPLAVTKKGDPIAVVLSFAQYCLEIKKADRDKLSVQTDNCVHKTPKKDVPEEKRVHTTAVPFNPWPKSGAK